MICGVKSMSDKNKVFFLICDGLGDRPLNELKGGTPLEAADTPVMDELAYRGITGIMDPISPGLPPPSDSAQLAIFGYPFNQHPGRGVIEALGSSIPLKKGELAFRCNIATVEEANGILYVKDRRAGRIKGDDAKEIEKLVNDIGEIKGVGFLFKHTLEHRGVLVLRGNLSRHVTDMDPHKVDVPVAKCIPREDAKDTLKARKTADILNEFTRKVYFTLKDANVNKERVKVGLPPGNFILIRGAGKLGETESFNLKWGFKAAAVAAAPMYRGIAKYLGMDLYTVPGGTGLPNTDYKGKILKALELLERYDFVYVHIKAPDVSSHKGNWKEKIEVIEKIDGALENILDSNNILKVVTTDHVTSCKSKMHTGDPVPILISGPNVFPDNVKRFCERTVYRGGLHRIKGLDLIPILMNLTNRSIEFGVQLTAKARFYFKSDYEPFSVQ